VRRGKNKRILKPETKTPNLVTFIYLAILLLADLALLLPVTRPSGALLLALVLPGWGWASWLRPRNWLAHSVLALGLSYTIAALGTLLLHYLPGGLAAWQMAALFNLVAIAPFAKRKSRIAHHNSSQRSAFSFVLIILLAIALRFANLGYSEFQGDEALAMTSAAEAIQGHADALFLRGKGPAEVLLPTAVWTLARTITEGVARLPFAIAGVMSLLALYLLAKDLFSPKVAHYAVAILAASGFMVGFSRIVQYQTIVVWMSILSLWTFWQWQQTDKLRWAFASGLFLGIGLLAHYDTILVAPAIGWLWLASFSRTAARRRHLFTAICWLLSAAITAATFYLPYLLNPQISRTGDYVSGRIGAGLKNHLADFLHFHVFYSSFYYVLIVGALLACFLVWAVWRARWGKLPGAAIAAAMLLGLASFPDLLGQWTIFPASLVLLAAFVSPALTTAQRTALAWFAVPFLGYNFAVATPLTHIYTTLPGWALLAGWSAAQVRVNQRVLGAINVALVLLSSLYLWNAFVRHDVEFLQDYPAGNLSLFWTPYPSPPQTGFFGFTHKSGWKTVGALLADGTLAGDYDSNEEEDVTGWYTRHAPRACDPGAEFVFISDDVVDAPPHAPETTAGEYTAVGQAVLSNRKTLTVYQRTPATADLGQLDVATLTQRFDQTAIPAAFAREAHWQLNANVNFSGKIKLVGYSLDARQAYPGGRILLTLYWQALTQLDESYKVFVHLDSEKKYAQADSVPVCARYPTTDWQVGQTISDQHALALSPATPSGQIPLVVGLYQPESGVRLDVLDEAGNPAGVSATLTTVQIQPIGGD